MRVLIRVIFITLCCFISTAYGQIQELKHKGEAFFKFCDNFGLKPQRIVCLDDKASHLTAIEIEAQKRGIEFIGLRYAFADRHKAEFRPEIADYQFSHSSFAKLLSDEEAKGKMVVAAE